MSMDNPLLNAGFALGGGIGSMPVALPFSLGGAAPGMMSQGGDMATGGAGVFGGASAALPMGMINRDGQQFMGQPQMTMPEEKGMSMQDKMKLMSMAAQSFNRGQQAMPSGNTSQIIRDTNQFRFAGNPQQQMAQALRQRG